MLEDHIDRRWAARKTAEPIANKARLIEWMLKVREGGWFREVRLRRWPEICKRSGGVR
jgi:hypothetical protein